MRPALLRALNPNQRPSSKQPNPDSNFLPLPRPPPLADLGMAAASSNYCYLSAPFLLFQPWNALN